ncbi:hypothetical protein MYSTI_02001 [Myxococcus stipitatus DSM 14675]|uniref:MalT-like TPR region domain-containing protein n=1 Tax=Myxococcus stipitatus (strain DSM 14675 / JCM 12634 / Mx s8) TaxID=1278073 RepID=L7U645_MYXSD|nr:tetratricopeptide repeat protein [Myxococcus stipitatus]AGC43330.1 hypothetical protein MYSTI_02001 [Myxococcus stipitatus DSM 14675]
MSDPDVLAAQARESLERWDLDAAAKAFREAVPLYRARGEVQRTCECLVELAGIGARTGDDEGRRVAVRDATEAAEGYRALGLRGAEGIALYWAGQAAYAESVEEEAGFYQAALPLLEGAGGEPHAPFVYACHVAMGRIAAQDRADLAGAEAHYLRAWELLSHAQSRLAPGSLARKLAEVVLKRGRPEESVAWLEKAMASLDAVSLEGARREAAFVQRCLGEARQRQGDLAAARAAYTRALRSFQHWGMDFKAREVDALLRALGADDT